MSAASVLTRAAELLATHKLEKNDAMARDRDGNVVSFKSNPASLSLLGAIYKAADEQGFPIQQVAILKEQMVIACFDLELDVQDENSLIAWAKLPERMAAEVRELLTFTAKAMDSEQ